MQCHVAYHEALFQVPCYLLFLYVSELKGKLGDFRSSLYADDTALFAVKGTLIEVMLTLRDELYIVEQWINTSLLMLKTGFILVCTKHKLSNLAI